MQSDHRITALIDSGINANSARHTMDLVYEPLKTEQKRKFQEDIMFELKTRIIYIMKGQRFINKCKKYNEIAKNKESSYNFMLDIIDDMYCKYNELYGESNNENDEDDDLYKQIFDTFFQNYYKQCLKTLDRHLNMDNINLLGWSHENKVFWHFSLFAISWLISPIRQDEENNILHFKTNGDKPELASLYFHINNQIEKHGFYKYDPNFE